MIPFHTWKWHFLSSKKWSYTGNNIGISLPKNTIPSEFPFSFFFLSKWIHESDSHAVWNKPYDTTRHGTAQHGTTRPAISQQSSQLTDRERIVDGRAFPIAGRLVVTSQQARTVRCRVKDLSASLPPLTAQPRPQSLLDLWCTKWHNYKFCCWWMSVYSSGVWG